MSGRKLLVSRLAAVALIIVMSLSMARVAGDGLDNVEDVFSETITDDGYVNVGWLSTVVNWNPLAVEMAEDYVVTYLIHSSLFTYDQDWNGPVNDLATGYTQVVHANGSMTTTITITHNAYFRNAADIEDTSHQLTASDVAFTLNLIKSNWGGAFDWYLMEVGDIRVVDDFTVSLWTPYAKATLIDDLAGIPIVPEYVWTDVLRPLGGMAPGTLVGSGPFVYEDMLKDAWYKFKRAPNYHGAADYPGVRDVDEGLNGILYTVYSNTPALCLAMNSGTEDTVVLTGDIPCFVEILGSGAAVNVIKAAAQENGICDVAINAIPEYFRTPVYGQGNPVLLDPEVRQALMMTLNKDYINEVLLQGLSTEAASVIDPGFWQKAIEDQLPYDPAGARAYLEANGWADGDADGYLEATPTAFGVQMGYFGVGTELSNIRCQAPDTDPTYGYITIAWTGWAEQAGIGLVPSIESEITMVNEAWYQADYDIWVWHWGWGPEPLGGALSCWLTSEMAVGGDNCQMPMGEWWVTADNYTDSPYVDAAMIDEFDMDAVDFVAFSSFDQNYSIATHTLDSDDRKVIVDRLQQMIYDSHTENPPYYDIGLYAYTDERFVGWGDWTAHTGRTTMSDLLWLWFDLAPRGDNLPPAFDVPLDPVYDVHMGEGVTFSVVVSDPDGDQLTINWSFGNGNFASTILTGDTTVPTEVTGTTAYLSLATDLTLSVTVHDGMAGHEVLSTAIVNVIEEPPAGRTAYYQWHNMFNEPFGEWWDWRYEYYGQCEVVSDMYPYIYRMHDSDGVSAYYSNMRLNVMTDSLPEVNMNSRPQFLPYLGVERGGTAVVDWYLQYLTSEEIAQHPEATAAWYDGWVSGLNGTAFLDSTAAKAVLGVTDEGLENFDMWWIENEDYIQTAFLEWMLFEGNDRLDIFTMYEYPLVPLAFDMNAYSYDGNVMLTYNMASWGMEALMTRWLHDAFMPNEWWFEDFRLHAEIYPAFADIDVDTAVVGALFAWKDVQTSTPSWVWRGMLQDYVQSSLQHPVSDYDAYVDLDYLDMYAGSASYGSMIPYEYTPGAFDLVEGETMSFQWPDGPQTFILDGGLNWIQTGQYGIADAYSEPSGYDLPDDVAVDPYLNTLTFEGPIDMYAWSENQSSHDYLESEWDRLGVLPYGMPWIEFRASTEAPEPAMIVVDMLHHAEIGQMVGINVTIADENWVPCTDYTGTLTFSSTDPYSVLPSDYTYTAEDRGTHFFWFVFYTEGEQWLTIADVADPNLTASTWFYVYLPSEVDQYEPDDYYDIANTIQMDEIQEHSIVPGWDVDWVTFSLDEDTDVGIRTLINGTGDTCLALFDQYGVPYSPIAYDDDSGGGLSSLITVTLPAGTYWIAVWSYNSAYEIQSYCLWLYETDVVNQPPVVGLTWWPYEPAPGQEVFFDGGLSYDPDGWITDWLWDFGDGTTAEGTWVNHTYQEAGVYYAMLTVVDNSGAQQTGTALVWVHENAEPVANLTYAPDTPSAGDMVYFDASGSYDPDGWIEYYVFDFGDGTWDFTYYPEAAHAYYSDGVYTVTVTVYDSGGLWASATVDVRVGDVAAAPVAIIAYEPSMPVVGGLTVFDASHSFDPDGAIVSYIWQFGDGDVAEGMTATHAYEHEGVYSVKLTVMDGDLMVDEDVVTITVASVPVPAMVYSPLDPDEGELVTFYAYGSYDEGGIVEYVWSFGDGTYASGWEAAHVFAEQGDYDVTLTVTNVYGVQASLTQTVEVGKGDSGVKGVVMSESLRPLKNAVVEVRTSSGALVGSTLTDAQGEFMIRDLVAGVYDLTVSKNGYADFTVSITVGAGVLDVGTIVLLDDQGSGSAAAPTDEESLWLVGAAGLVGMAMLGGFLVSRKKDSEQ